MFLRISSFPKEYSIFFMRTNKYNYIKLTPIDLSLLLYRFNIFFKGITIHAAIFETPDTQKKLTYAI